MSTPAQEPSSKTPPPAPGDSSAGLAASPNAPSGAKKGAKPALQANKPNKTSSRLSPIAWFLSKISRGIWHIICHVIPLYLIIGAIIVIALPSTAKLNWWPFIQQDIGSASTQTAQSPAQSTLPPSATAAPPSTYTANASNSRTISPVAGAQEDVKLTNIAKLAIDATKERVDMMKESYEKIFSFIAAFAALLAFLGFKGIETFTQTKNNAQEAATQAEAAAQDAAAAKEEAQAAIEELHNFIENQYKIDNSSEINVSHGIILREIASLQKSLTDQNNPECKKRHRDFLRQSLYYLDLATENKSQISTRILSRAYVTKGNVQNMLGDYSKALDAAMEAISVNELDHSAHFNAACYNSKLAEKYNAEGDYGHAEALVNNAIKHLRLATDLKPEYKESMKTETDFSYIKDYPAFNNIHS